MVPDAGPVTVNPKLAVICSVRVALFDGSAALVAVTVTLLPVVPGRILGAVNIPPVVMVPQAAPLHPVPLTAQVTFWLAPLPVLAMLALTCCAAPSSTLEFCAGAVMLTTTSLVTVTVEVAEVVPSAMLMARMLTVEGTGRNGGAV